MCELFAISSNLPTTVTFSLEEFSRHGGLTASHKDGWGIAFYANNDAQHLILSFIIVDIYQYVLPIYGFRL